MKEWHRNLKVCRERELSKTEQDIKRSKIGLTNKEKTFM